MRKKILFCLFLILINFTLLSATLGNEETLTFNLNTAENERSEVGFSSGQVTESSTTVTPLSQIYLSSNAYVSGESLSISATNNTSWVYWKIVSPNNLNIFLRIESPLTATTGDGSGINWRVRGYSENDGEETTIYASTFTADKVSSDAIHKKSTLQDISSTRIVVEAEISEEDFLKSNMASYSSELIVEVRTT